ncbi:MauE/DoxX family redox-associated membrane protein [Novosphingobium silvae]|uniref:MauE/DoxX family redox-associated membrane protein n=1 Tax=Novosphingobium silvae TaxID=2692619 RepID=UPI003B023748
MKWLVRLIDQDVVASLNSVQAASRKPLGVKRFNSTISAIHFPRWTWIRLIVPLITLCVLLVLSPEPVATYGLWAAVGLLVTFFGLYFYRLALIRQRWLDKRCVDEFGSYEATEDDRYEVPPS